MYQHYFIAVVLFVLAASAAIHALLNKSDSRSAFGWIAVSLIFPLFGPVLYFLFGINRTENRAVRLDYYSRKRNFDSRHHQTHIIKSLKNVQNVAHQLTKLPSVGGNSVEVLYSGSQAYPAMLKAIHSAQHYIYLSTYIFKVDEIGKQFIEALTQAKQRGVKVYVLIDGIGDYYSKTKASKILKKNGINVDRFLPPRLIPFNIYINLRNHRKILVADNEVCFVGGMNISEEYAYNNNDSPKDIHFKLTGNITQQVKHLFESDWRFTNHQDINIAEKSVEIIDTDLWCRAINDGPGINMGHLSIVLFSAINAATDSIVIMSPYFLPSLTLVHSLEVAALRGIDVSIILPEKNNLFYVDWACRHMLWQLVASGINIYYQPPPFEHSKLFIVDNQYSLIGSANFDPRSLRLNYEIGVEIYDEHLATELSNYTQKVIENSHLITLEELEQRSFAVKIRDGIAWLFSPYL
jgi:cardiolipin synthase